MGELAEFGNEPEKNQTRSKTARPRTMWRTIAKFMLWGSLANSVILNGASRGDTAESGYPPPRDYIHNKNISQRYDKFEDLTFFTLRLDKVIKKDNFSLDMTFYRTTKGKDRGKGPITLFFQGTSSNGWRYLKYHDVTLLVEGDRWAFDTEHDGEVETGGVRETFSVSLDESKFLKLANASSIQIKVGNDRFRIYREGRAAIKHYASLIDNQFAAIVTSPTVLKEMGPPPSPSTIPAGLAMNWPSTPASHNLVFREVSEFDGLTSSALGGWDAFDDYAASAVDRGRMVELAECVPLRILDSVAIKGRSDTTLWSKVEILEGDNQGYVGWVLDSSVIKSSVGRSASASSSPPVLADNRAERLETMAKNHEKNRNTKAAIQNYREILEKHPGSPQAEAARDRLIFYKAIPANDPAKPDRSPVQNGRKLVPQP